MNRMNNYLISAADYYLQNGGIINTAIFLCAVFSLYSILERYCYYRTLHRKIKKHELSIEDILIERINLSLGIDSIFVWISAAPLLGLLGTVIGMISTFRTIMNYGNSNPVFLTEGISLALHTTQAGLLVSIPILILYSFLARKREKISELLSLDRSL